MAALVLYGNKLSIKVTREFKQLVNISIAAGKHVAVFWSSQIKATRTLGVSQRGVPDC